jgi:phage-related protein
VLGKTLTGVNSAVGGALSTLTGAPGGALSSLAGAVPSVSTSVKSSSGDSTSGLDQSFNYNAAFQVGGSGKQTQNAGISAGGDTPLYLAIGGIVLFLALRVMRRQ